MLCLVFKPPLLYPTIQIVRLHPNNSLKCRYMYICAQLTLLLENSNSTNMTAQFSIRLPQFQTQRHREKLNSQNRWRIEQKIWHARFYTELKTVLTGQKTSNLIVIDALVILNKLLPIKYRQIIACKDFLNNHKEVL